MRRRADKPRGYLRFADCGFSDRTIRALLASGIDAPERLLSMASDRIRLIHGVGPTLMKEVERYRSKVTPANKKPRAFQRFARGLSGHIPTNKIRSSDLLSLPAPAEQSQRAEPGSKEWKSSGERSGGWTCLQLSLSQISFVTDRRYVLNIPGRRGTAAAS